ncbi:chondroitinase family polysaccharide lyase [Chryseobacterium tongliaoense]|uniref:chondroitinase family polysaccharide lyase n=1 Tax=Chryseobacterium tongliaoense TaxID=3240933 RepID=UPI0035136645
MFLRFIIFCFIISSFSIKAQINEINNIKTKYINWLTGEGADYSKTEVSSRYNRYIGTNLTNAKAFADGLDLNNPGPVWDIVNNNNDKSALRNTVETQLIRLVFPYCIKGPIVNGNPSNSNYHNPQLLAQIIKVFDYLQAKGISSSSNFTLNVDIPEQIVEMGGSTGLRMGAYSTSVMMMKEELVNAGKFVHHFSTVGKITEFLDPDYGVLTFTYPGSNTDMMRSLSQQRFCYILSEDDSSDKIADMDFLKAYLNNALKISYGWADKIKPDLMTFHHRGAYSNTYGENAVNVISTLNLILKNTPYELSPEARDLLKRTTLNWTKFSNRFEIPRGLTGRFPNDTQVLNNLMYAMALQYIADPVGNQVLGKEFRRLWNTCSTSERSALYSNATTSINVLSAMNASQNIVQTLAENPVGAVEVTGSFGFPYAGLSTHKYNGAMVSVKGTSKHIWHYENAGSAGGTGENRFGRYQSAGAMEILTGSPSTRAASGLGVNGWDWAHIPGTTVAYLTPDQMNDNQARLFSGKLFLAHANLDATYGVFGMDYKDANSPTSATAFKTNFFYKDKILCLGSGINDVNGTNSIHTTLFQTTLTTANTPTVINGTTHNVLNDVFSQNGGGVWATDGVGNAYVVPAGTINNSELKIVRSNQISKDESGANITNGNYATAYFNHGIAPANSSYQYAIAVQGGTAGAQDLYNNFSNYFSVLQQDNNAHVVRFVAEDIFNYVIFNATTNFNVGVLKNANKPCVVMTQLATAGNSLKVSLTNPNLGIMPLDAFYTLSQINSDVNKVNSIPQQDPVKITVAGKWVLQNPANDVTATINGNDTELIFNTINGLTIQTTLIPEAFLNVQNVKYNNENFTISPNPSKGKASIIFKNNLVSDIRIMDMGGRDVTSGVPMVKENKRVHLDVNNLATGTYMVCADNTCKKLIKQ